jgi:hypothetical protein
VNFQLDMEAIQETSARRAEASRKVQGVNQRYATRVESLLAEADRPAFAEEFRRRSFPRVYRESNVSRMVSAAIGFEDLSPEQKGELEAIKSQYDREVAAANAAWASAIEQDESGGGSQTMVGGAGGSMIRLGLGDESGPVSDAAKARRQVDSKVRERLMAILSEDQRAMLPRAREPGSDGAGEHEIWSTQSVVVEIDDSQPPADEE